MKIGYLVLTTDTKTGGGRYASNIIEGAKSSGHKVIILKEAKDGPEGQAVLQRGWRLFFCIKKTRGLLADCDVIHAIDAYPYGAIGWLANRSLHKKLIIGALGTYAVAPLYQWPNSFLLKCAYKSADKVVAISRFTQREILKKITLNNCMVITPGIKVETVSDDRHKPDKPFILGVGAIKERKGYHVSLSAFAKVAKAFPAVNYIIVADPFPPFQKILDKIVEDNNLKDRVKFLSNVSEEKLQDLYRSAELFILTPINTEDHHIEGFGLVYLEAAKRGLPVIGTKDTGAEDAIKNGYNGILVPQNDVSKTAEALVSILSDKQKQENFSKAGYEWANLNNTNNEIQKFLTIYQGKIK